MGYLQRLANIIRSAVCHPNLRNPAKFSENSNLYSSRLSKVIDLDVNRKRIMQLSISHSYSDFGRISYSFRDIDALSFKIACFSHPTLV